jgi:hypothetical protein
MTWAEANAALLLLSEERVGTRVRELGAQEDAAYERSKAVLRGSR